MRVIFMDIDGVLIRIGKGLLRKGRHIKGTGGLLNDFNMDLIANFKELLEKTKAKIIISSSWRHDMERVKKSFEEAGLDWNLVIGKTPNGLGYGRGNEILTYMYEHNKDLMMFEEHIDSWIAIDDDSADMKCVNRLGRFIHTKSHEGLTKEKIEEAILLLKD